MSEDCTEPSAQEGSHTIQLETVVLLSTSGV